MKKHGVGVACMYYGIGKTGVAGPASAYAEIQEDGTVIVATGLADMGEGADTALAQIAADVLGMPLSKVNMVVGDTATTPDAGVTSASRSVYVVGNAVYKAVRAAMAPLLRAAGERLDAGPDEIVAGPGRLYVKGDPERGVPLAEMIAIARRRGEQTVGAASFVPAFEALDPETGQGSPYPTYAFATQICEVEVDTETGVVTVLRFVAAHDVGKAINPLGVAGQIEGGIAMGLGFALTEEIKFDRGRILNPTFSTYMVPTSLDVCDIETVIVEDPEPSGPFGAKGVGEPALIPTASAIAGAIFDAVGVLVTELPVTPERLLALLAARQAADERVAA